jgi:hypothetical protein
MPRAKITDGEVLYFSQVLHLRQREIAEMYGMTEGGVSDRLRRIRQRRIESGLGRELTPDEARSLEQAHSSKTPLGLTQSEVKDLIEEYSQTDPDALMELAAELSRQMAIVDPVVTHIDIDWRHITEPMAIGLFGCFQIGGRYTFHSFIRDRINDVLSHPRVYMASFGDEIEGFLPDSFAGARSIMEQALPPMLQFPMWLGFLDKVKDKVLWGLGSQHGSHWEERRVGSPTKVKKAYMERNIPFFDGMGYVRVHLGSQTYNLAVAHEFPGNSMYNPAHPHKRALWQRFPIADVLAMADKHQSAIHRENVYSNEVEIGNRKSTAVHFLQIGTAKGGPDPYTMRGWERGQTEWPIVVLYPDEHRVKVSEDINDIRFWLGD